MHRGMRDCTFAPLLGVANETLGRMPRVMCGAGLWTQPHQPLWQRPWHFGRQTLCQTAMCPRHVLPASALAAATSGPRP